MKTKVINKTGSDYCHDSNAINRNQHGILEYSVSAQDPWLGIRNSNIAAQLNRDNWQSKALLLKQDSTRHYIYLNQATRIRRRQRIYCVHTYDIQQQLAVSEACFIALDDALNFANRGAANSLALTA